MHTAIPAVAGVPIEFILFAAGLAGVALFHHHSLRVALIGLAVITLYKIASRRSTAAPAWAAWSRIWARNGCWSRTCCS